jgi:hypothetical protein
MSDFKRKRLFYTKPQITNGLVTKGEEWMFSDGTEYIGQYHKYTTGEVFTESNFVQDKSRKLIPYVRLQTENGELVELIGGSKFDFGKNFIYDDIKTVKIKKSKSPSLAMIKVSDKDIKRGWMVRYFASKVNDEQILELNKTDYDKVGTDKGLPQFIWEKFNLRWKISGRMNDLVDPKTGIITESGIIDTNQRTIDLVSEEYPDLVDILVDLTEFSV